LRRPRFSSSLRRPSPVSASTATRRRRWCKRFPPRTSRAPIRLTWSRRSCSASPASPPTTSRAMNLPRTYATVASRHRRCGRGDWKLGLFHTDSQNEIIQVASALQGRGVFQNVPLTRRQGVEAGADYRTEKYLVYANYAFIDATYQFSGELASPNN